MGGRGGGRVGGRGGGREGGRKGGREGGVEEGVEGGREGGVEIGRRVYVVKQKPRTQAFHAQASHVQASLGIFIPLAPPPCCWPSVSPGPQQSPAHTSAAHGLEALRRTNSIREYC